MEQTATMAEMPSTLSFDTMKIAVEGCCHGHLDAIYGHINQLETRYRYKVDILLICGDFQAIRNHQDLQCMSVPQKYKALGDFYKYYTGEKTAPLLTIVIGGNHEASNYFWELYHGGWLAPNIYFLGHSGSVVVNGVKIAGASGIFKVQDFRLGHHEKVPYDSGALRSIYHVREYCIRKLSLLPSSRVFLSHDWPQHIEQHGDVHGLLSRKKFFRQDVETGQLGSPPLMGLLHTLRPEWWFAAHLHTRFEATVVHQVAPAPVQPVHNPDEITIDDDDFEDIRSAPNPEPPTRPRNPDEIALDEEEVIAEMPLAPPPAATPSETRFLALDKCLPRRDFLEVIDLAAPGYDTLAASGDSALAVVGPTLSFDPDWLAITRAFHPFLSTTRHQPPFPEEVEARVLVTKEREWVSKNIATNSRGEIPVLDHQQFVMTAPGPGTEGNNINRQPPWYTNPQTVAFCRMLDIPNKINPPPSTSTGGSRTSEPSTVSVPPLDSAGA